MSLDQIKKDISSGTVYPVYLFHGEESYLIDEASAFLEAHLLQEHEKAFDQQILYGVECTARHVLEQLLLFPLMGPRRLVIIREAQLMDDIKDLEPYLSRPAPSSVLVLCYKGKTMDKRLKVYDAIKNKGFILTAEALKEKDVLPWLLRTVGSQGMKMEPEAGEAMIELIGGEISLLYPAIKKLAITHSAEKAITYHDIADAIGLSREYNVIELQNALEAGNVIKTLRIGTRMGEQKGYSLIPLIALLTGYYSRLYAVKSLGDASDAAIGEAIANKSSYYIEKIRKIAKRYSLQTLEHCIGWLHNFDMRSKGWGYNGGDHQALTIELLDRLLYPDPNQPASFSDN